MYNFFLKLKSNSYSRGKYFFLNTDPLSYKKTDCVIFISGHFYSARLYRQDLMPFSPHENKR